MRVPPGIFLNVNTITEKTKRVHTLDQAISMTPLRRAACSDRGMGIPIRDGRRRLARRVFEEVTSDATKGPKRCSSRKNRRGSSSLASSPNSSTQNDVGSRLLRESSIALPSPLEHITRPWTRERSPPLAPVAHAPRLGTRVPLDFFFKRPRRSQTH